LGVYEDRAARSGRIISLRLVILKAKHSAHHAIAVVAGGPGQSAVSLAPMIADGMRLCSAPGSRILFPTALAGRAPFRMPREECGEEQSQSL
jgi:hypothetical protein